MQETFSIGINGPDCAQRKQELVKAAEASGKKSVSRFLLWLFDEYKKRQERRAHVSH